MARKPVKKAASKPPPSKEKIKAPTKAELTAAGKDTKKGDSAGGRVLSAESVAKREGVKPAPSPASKPAAAKPPKRKKKTT